MVCKQPEVTVGAILGVATRCVARPKCRLATVLRTKGEHEMENDEKVFPKADRPADGVDSPAEGSLIIPTLEKDLEEFLAHNLDLIEKGLTLYEEDGRGGRQFEIDGGRIDLLCKDRGGDIVVIELKAVEAGDAAVGQLLGYVGFLSRRRFWGRRVRGVLVAPQFSERAKHAAALACLTLLRYHAVFSFDEVEMSGF